MSMPAASSYPPGRLDEYQGNQLLAFAAVMVVVQVVVVALRFAARAFSHLFFGIEEVLVVGALIADLGCDITTLNRSISPSNPRPVSEAIPTARVTYTVSGERTPVQRIQKTV
ncbi:hypothetical protein MMC13_004489 [Lambiella insularis]|nr:hypothetical protein [Lambiella insularis]